MTPSHCTPVLALLVFTTVACSRETTTFSGTTAAADSSTAVAAKTSLGNVMVQLARRFEIAGRAANANRFELAEFEAGEIQELFETDVPGAALPKEGPTGHIPAMAKAFLEDEAPELEKGAAAKDRAAFAIAFRRVASACNRCHLASAKGFIQVPSELGKPVPDLDPISPSVPPPP